MTSIANLTPTIRAFRPFLPAKDFCLSLRFYEALGFASWKLGETLAELRLGENAFLLQGYYVKDWAENMMMHVLVDDLRAWWEVINSLELDCQFGVPKPGAPKVEDWGLTVCYVHDPAGVLWHFAEAPHNESAS